MYSHQIIARSSSCGSDMSPSIWPGATGMRRACLLSRRPRHLTRRLPQVCTGTRQPPVGDIIMSSHPRPPEPVLRSSRNMVWGLGFVCAALRGGLIQRQPPLRRNIFYIITGEVWLELGGKLVECLGEGKVIGDRAFLSTGNAGFRFNAIVQTKTVGPQPAAAGLC